MKCGYCKKEFTCTESEFFCLNRTTCTCIDCRYNQLKEAKFSSKHHIFIDCYGKENKYKEELAVDEL